MDAIEWLGDRGPLVIAELGGNHGGQLALAKRMVDAAVSAGAQVVKFQTYVTRWFISVSDPAFPDFEREALSFDAFRELALAAVALGAQLIEKHFAARDLTAVRPEWGIPASEVDGVVGRQAKTPLKRLTALQWSDLE